MSFNSYNYLLFFGLTFIVYWFFFGKKTNSQNVLLVGVSYFFYALWDWRFLGLIILSSFVDFYIGQSIFKSTQISKKKILLWISILVNLGMLGFFKYANFFIESFNDLLLSIGFQTSTSSLNIILPVGISFYTFQTMSYTIDIYHKKIKPTNNIVAFFAFVSFFPQLVAGPIERAKNLLPQFVSKRSFSEERASDGLRQILWGLFKKVVIADNCALLVDTIFENHDAFGSGVLVLGAVLFAFQIYADFSAYSDIAIGSARILGFDLMQNFSTPYFSQSISEFWRRWHISLSTWFRDYVYIPLGGSRVSRNGQARNILLTFTVSGLWHGANWTFIFWGFLNGLYMLPRIFRQKKDIQSGSKFLVISKIALTFFLTCFTWIFFRSESIGQAFSYINGMCSNTSIANELGLDQIVVFKSIVGIAVLLGFDFFYKKYKHSFDIRNMIRPLRWASYLFVLSLIYFLGNFDSKVDFIYFQF